MIERDPSGTAASSYDLAVIGGGIHGVSVALEAARRGLGVVLIEKSDFGSGASGNSLRILHGGLRYLQTLDLARFRESVRERRWFARNFPALVEPMSCLMPLYGRGMKRSAVLRAALAINDCFSADRNAGVDRGAHLPRGTIVGSAELRERFAQVRTEGLEGAAQWFDYRMRSSERVLIEMLHWACGLGVRAMNYCDVQDIATEGPQVVGLSALDLVDNTRHEIRASTICNCTGSQTRLVASKYAVEQQRLFVPSAAFNILLECDALSDSALAVAAPEPAAPVHFLCPSPLGLWAGTGHAGRPDGCTDAAITEAELQQFLGQVNRAIPGLSLGLRNIRKVYSGLLPVKTVGDTNLTAREVIADHGAQGGPKGFYSVAGIKFTTARRVGERAVSAMFGRDAPPANRDDSPQRPRISGSTAFLLDGAQAMRMETELASRAIREVANTESVVKAEDFLQRRTNWMFSSVDMAPLERLVQAAMAERSVN